MLGIPARSLESLDWDPLHNDQQVISDLKSHRGVPATKVYLSFNRPWWRELKDIRWVVTDLPVRQSMEMQVRPDGSALLLATYCSGDNAEFWEGLTKQGFVIRGNIPNQYNVTDKLLDQLLTMIAESMGINKNDIPAPTGAAMHIWKSDPIGYAWYSLYPGHDWQAVRERMAKPRRDQEVYVVSTFGHWEHSKWGDGTIRVAEYALERYFGKKVF